MRKILTDLTPKIYEKYLKLITGGKEVNITRNKIKKKRFQKMEES